MRSPCVSRPSLVRSRQREALSALLRAVAATGVLCALAACGGGGVDSPASPPASPSPPGPIAAQLSVPAPVGYDADRLAAFNRLNEIRLSAGLGMLAQNTLLDQAAQAHADWIIANDSFMHEEGVGTAGFTGAHWWDRDEALGYEPNDGAEVMAAGAGAAVAGVEGLVNAVYHRSSVLAFEPVDVGIGWSALSAANVSMPLVIDLTRPGRDPIRGVGQAAQPTLHGIAIWPLDGARGVPLRLGLESPNPVPSQDVLTLGTPASITVDRLKTISTLSFIMTNSATGQVIATQLLTFQNDPHVDIPSSFVALIPLSPLEPNATYQVRFSGSAVEFGSNAHESIDRAWTFTTGA